MSKTVTESIYDCDGFTIPLAEVQHIESCGANRVVVFKSTTWNGEQGVYNNTLFLMKDQAERFLVAWCRYRSELEAATLMDLSPAEPEIFPRTYAALDSLSIRSEDSREEAKP